MKSGKKKVLLFFFFPYKGKFIWWYKEGSISLENRNIHEEKIWETEKSLAEAGLVGKQLGG